MSNFTTLTGQLDRNDFVFPAPGGVGNTRVDEFDLNASLVGQPITIALTSTIAGYDPFLEVVDANTGTVLADSDDDGGSSNALIAPGLPNNGAGFDDPLVPNALTIQGSTDYKIRVTSYSSLTEAVNPYNLQVSVPLGDVELAPRNTGFSGSMTGGAVSFSGRLDGDDVSFPAPAGGGNTWADEFQLDASLVGQPVTIALTSTTSGYDPFLEVIDADTGTVLADSDDDGGSLNSLIAPGLPNNGAGLDDPFVPNALTVQGGVDYRIRVSSYGAFPTPTAPVGDYDLQVSVPQGTVSVTPRMPNASVIRTTPVVDSTEPGPITGYEPFSHLENPGGGPWVYFLSDNPDIVSLSDFPQFAGNYVLALSSGDNILGMEGNDFYINGNAGADSIDTRSGDDLCLGGRSSDNLMGGEGNDSLFGNRHNDSVYGGAGDDRVQGGQQDDVLMGGTGNDILIGDLGADVLTGDAGADTFVLRSDGDAVAATLQQADIIRDFRMDEGDLIGLNNSTGFADLAFESVNLTFDGVFSGESTAIRLGSTGPYLGIVEGIPTTMLTESDFTSINFV